MARYTITYNCGCTTEMQLFGKYSERENKINYYKTIDCPCCRAKAVQAEADALNLPRLTGSDKQIAWAHDIRMKAIGFVAELKTKSPKAELIAAGEKALLSNVDSRFWIDNRTDLNINFISFVEFFVSICKNISK